MFNMDKFIGAGATYAFDLGRPVGGSVIDYGTTIEDSEYGPVRRFIEGITYLENLNAGIFELDSSTTNNMCVLTRFKKEAGRQYVFGDYAGGNYLQVQDDGASLRSGGGLSDLVNFDIPADEWVTLVINTQPRPVYHLNGVEVGQAPTYGAYSGTIEDIGYNRHRYGFGGLMKEIIIFDRNLKWDEIEAYHNQTLWDYDKDIESKWEFDNNVSVRDIGWKNAGCDGVVVGSPDVVTGYGNSMGIEFDGSTTAVNTCFNIIPQSTDFGIMFWFKIDSLSAQGAGHKYTLVSAGGEGLHVYIDPSDNKMHVEWGGQVQFSPSLHDFTGDTDWHVVTISGKIGVNYIDIDLDHGPEQGFSGGTSYTGNTGLTFGAVRDDISGTGFQGVISKPLVFKKTPVDLDLRDLINRQMRGEV